MLFGSELTNDTFYGRSLWIMNVELGATGHDDEEIFAWIAISEQYLTFRHPKMLDALNTLLEVCLRYFQSVEALES